MYCLSGGFPSNKWSFQAFDLSVCRVTESQRALISTKSLSKKQIENLEILLINIIRFIKSIKICDLLPCVHEGQSIVCIKKTNHP